MVIVSVLPCADAKTLKVSSGCGFHAQPGKPHADFRLLSLGAQLRSSAHVQGTKELYERFGETAFYYSFDVNPDGSIANLAKLTTSGSSQVDQSAEDLIKGAQPFKIKALRSTLKCKVEFPSLGVFLRND
jgi:hypothetical protein